MMALQWYLRVSEVEDLNPSRKSDFAVSTHYQEETTLYIFYIVLKLYIILYFIGTILQQFCYDSKEQKKMPFPSHCKRSIPFSSSGHSTVHQSRTNTWWRSWTVQSQDFWRFFPKTRIDSIILLTSSKKYEIDTTHIHKLWHYEQLWTIMNSIEAHFPWEPAWKLREAVRGKCVPWDQCFPVV